ncbi:MAG: nitrile hydratase subunit beta [Rhodospirillales bacterium]|nr:nitrile hydratase subunit beta [Rhodospirillales bacterium]
MTRYTIGAAVAVRSAYPPGHVRAPFFIRGKTGTVEQVVGSFGNPEELAYGRNPEQLTLYRVRFQQADVWSGYTGPGQDTLVIDIYENWLDPAAGDHP